MAVYFVSEKRVAHDGKARIISSASKNPSVKLWNGHAKKTHTQTKLTG
jgi:hypothetical protein